MSKFTSARSVQGVQHGWHLFKNRRTLWQMIRETLRGEYKMSFLTILICILAIAYVIFPFDLIPDYIPVVGWIDDGIVIFLLLKRLQKETQRFIRFKASQRRNGNQ